MVKKDKPESAHGPSHLSPEQFAVFAANFVRWAAHWLTEQCPQTPSTWQNSASPKVKEQVKKGAHTSAWMDWQDQCSQSRACSQADPFL
jgi:hypothetical protein